MKGRIIKLDLEKKSKSDIRLIKVSRVTLVVSVYVFVYIFINFIDIYLGLEVKQSIISISQTLIH